jgi:transposase
MTEDKRNYRTSQQKVAILKEHLVDRKTVSEVCEAHGVAPGLFYGWLKLFFENGAAAFEKDSSAEHRELQRKVDALTDKLARKDSVIAEVTEEFVKLKKSLGEP